MSKEVVVNLNEWKAVNPDNQHFWTVTDSTLVGGTGEQKIPVNTYLSSKETYKDFELRCLFRLTGDHNLGLINSGIQYRSIVEGNKISGYQADIGKGYWGDIYDEHRRKKLIDGDMSVLKQLLNDDGWNSYIVRCKGDVHELYINGVKTTEYQELNKDIPSEGVIAFQLHKGGNAKIEVKNITITKL
ncbi:DUF1080 domain-containing protein [Algibacter miyuki]|uniref:DUF1080 domain-containing protein n=1 Tax=Algibacter miyuki TaxID=1306933 RepID=A0ABV5H0C8_9FLAO|nr:DUF1080 domain-containing protein [Algibacter miyuki]MDN3667412.1 DUF1080 domain-containing protein [Algibacter miyuki]